MSTKKTSTTSSKHLHKQKFSEHNLVMNSFIKDHQIFKYLNFCQSLDNKFNDFGSISDIY